jgi:hypothetical protein
MAMVAATLSVWWLLGEGGHMVNGAAVTSPDFMAAGPPFSRVRKRDPEVFSSLEPISSAYLLEFLLNLLLFSLHHLFILFPEMTAET